MDAKKAKNILDSTNLIPGKISQSILKAIINDEIIDVPNEICKNRYAELKKLYQEKITTLNLKKSTPRNLPFYLILKDLISQFDFEIATDCNVKISAPRIKNLRPSLLSLLLGIVNTEQDTWLHRLNSNFSNLSNSNVTLIADCFKQANIIIPEAICSDVLVKWFEKGLRGEKLHLVMSVCPDYSTEATNDPKIPYRYNFKFLGNEIGIVGKKSLVITQKMFELFNQLNLSVDITIAMADFEAFDKSNLAALNISEDNFMLQIEETRNKISKIVPPSVKTTFFTHLCNGKNTWESYYKKLELQIEQANYGHSGLHETQVSKIFEARLPLYQRWLGKSASIPNCMSIFRKQIVAYATKGAILSEHLQNALVIGLDQVVMAQFLNVYQKLPTLYVRSFYD